jgi:hypothetical protein
VNPRLLDDDNVSSDAIKRRKVEAVKSTDQMRTSATLSRSQSQSQPTILSEPSTSRQASVEAVHNEDDITCHNAGRPKNPNAILESVNEDDEDIYATQLATDAEQIGRKESGTEEQAETDEDELGKSSLWTLLMTDIYALLPACLQKDWRSRVYAFFQSEVGIVYIDDQKCHQFTCNAKHCKGKGKNVHIVRRYLDTQKTKLQQRVSVRMLLNVGVRRLSRNQRMPKILLRRERCSRVQSFMMDLLQQYLNGPGRGR